MSDFKFFCPHCGLHIKCSPAYAGRQIHCPACGQSLVVPSANSLPAQPSKPVNIPIGSLPETRTVQNVAQTDDSHLSVMAITALTASLIFLSPVAIVCGHLARRAIKKNTQLTGGGMALAGLIIGYVSLAASLAVAAILILHDRGQEIASVPAQTNTSANTTGVQSTAPASTPEKKSSANIKTSPRPISKKPTVATTVFLETFETGLDKWVVVPDSITLTVSDNRNHTSDGKRSAEVKSSSCRMFRNLGSNVEGHSRAVFWIYDDTQTRFFGEVRSYSGKGYGDGSMKQILSIGRQDTAFTSGTGTLANESLNQTKYQARVFSGDNAGRVNLQANKAPSRSKGWHKFEIERESDNSTINFYVDGVLGATVTGAKPAAWNTLVIGSVGMGDVEGMAWFDDVSVETLAARP